MPTAPPLFTIPTSGRARGNRLLSLAPPNCILATSRQVGTPARHADVQSQTATASATKVDGSTSSASTCGSLP